MKNEIEIPINLTNLSEAIKMARELNQLLDSAKAKIDGLKESFPDFRIPADIDESVIGQNIKKIRKKQGLTQKELGERLGITQQTVAQYERATEQPKISTVRKIADGLGVPVKELIEG